MLKRSFLLAGLMFAGACFAPTAQAEEQKTERKYSKVARVAMTVNDLTWDVILPVLFYIKYSLEDRVGFHLDSNGIVYPKYEVVLPQGPLGLVTFSGAFAALLVGYLGRYPKDGIQSIIDKYDVADDQADDQKSHKEFKASEKDDSQGC